MTEDLKPCPFCGAGAKLHPVARDWWRIVSHHDADCLMDDCYAPTAPQTPEQKELLIAAWNRRAALASSEAQAGEAVAYVRQSDLDDLKDPRIAGKGCFLNKGPREGFVAIHVAPPAGSATRDALLAAARTALHEMCNTAAPRDSFTNAVDVLDAAIDQAAKEKENG